MPSTQPQPEALTTRRQRPTPRCHRVKTRPTLGSAPWGSAAREGEGHEKGEGSVKKTPWRWGGHPRPGIRRPVRGGETDPRGFVNCPACRFTFQSGRPWSPPPVGRRPPRRSDRDGGIERELGRPEQGVSATVDTPETRSPEACRTRTRSSRDRSTENGTGSRSVVVHPGVHPLPLRVTLSDRRKVKTSRPPTSTHDPVFRTQDALDR